MKELAAKPNVEAWIRWPFNAQFGYDARPMHRTFAGTSWSYSPDVRIALGGNVTFLCMQVAFWHGVQELLIVGLDHDYFEYEGMPKHFDRKYVFAPDEHPQMKGMILDPEYAARHRKQVDESFDLARQIFEADGRRIINLTEGSKCESFERGSIDDWTVTS